MNTLFGLKKCIGKESWNASKLRLATGMFELSFSSSWVLFWERCTFKRRGNKIVRSQAYGSALLQGYRAGMTLLNMDHCRPAHRFLFPLVRRPDLCSRVGAEMKGTFVRQTPHYQRFAPRGSCTPFEPMWEARIQRLFE